MQFFLGGLEITRDPSLHRKHLLVTTTFYQEQQEKAPRLFSILSEAKLNRVILVSLQGKAEERVE